MSSETSIKRRSPRFRLPTRSPLPAALTSDSVAMIGMLMDISMEGFRFISRENLPDFWLPGRSVVAEFRIAGDAYRGEGHIRHLTKLINGQTSLGFQFVDNAIPEAQWNRAVDQLIRDKHAGSVWAVTEGSGTQINIIGCFTGNLSDEFISSVKGKSISCIDLSQCLTVDGDGLELLRKSHSLGMKIKGAVGAVKTQLSQQGIPLAA